MKKDPNQKVDPEQIIRLRCKRYEHLAADPDLTPTAYQCGNLITARVDNNTGVATIGYDRMAKFTKRPRSCVVEAVELLVARGHYVRARLGCSMKGGRMLPSQYRDGPYRPASTVDDPTVPAGDHGTVPAGQYGQSSQTVPAGRHGQKADRTGFDPPTVPSGRTDSMYLNEEEGSLATALPAGALASPRKEEAPPEKEPEICSRQWQELIGLVRVNRIPPHDRHAEAKERLQARTDIHLNGGSVTAGSS